MKIAKNLKDFFENEYPKLPEEQYKFIANDLGIKQETLQKWLENESLPKFSEYITEVLSKYEFDIKDRKETSLDYQLKSIKSWQQDDRIPDHPSFQKLSSKIEGGLNVDTKLLKNIFYSQNGIDRNYKEFPKIVENLTPLSSVLEDFINNKKTSPEGKSFNNFLNELQNNWKLTNDKTLSEVLGVNERTLRGWKTGEKSPERYIANFKIEQNNSAIPQIHRLNKEQMFDLYSVAFGDLKLGAKKNNISVDNIFDNFDLNISKSKSQEDRENLGKELYKDVLTYYGIPLYEMHNQTGKKKEILSNHKAGKTSFAIYGSPDKAYNHINKIFSFDEKLSYKLTMGYYGISLKHHNMENNIDLKLEDKINNKEFLQIAKVINLKSNDQFLEDLQISKTTYRNVIEGKNNLEQSQHSLVIICSEYLGCNDKDKIEALLKKFTETEKPKNLNIEDYFSNRPNSKILHLNSSKNDLSRVEGRS